MGLSRRGNFVKLRSHMLDWFLEIFQKYRVSPETFFVSATLFDDICRLYKKRLGWEDVHLVGTAVVFLASKLENSTPISVFEVSRDISHSKFSTREIILHEAFFLGLLDFRLHK